MLLAIRAGNSPVTGEFRAQRPVTRSFDVFLDLRLNKRLSKQSWSWWSETPSTSLWRHCNVFTLLWRHCTALQNQHQNAVKHDIVLTNHCSSLSQEYPDWRAADISCRSLKVNVTKVLFQYKGRLILSWGIPIPVRPHTYIGMAPRI